jgi:anthranilate phosphoribosyltransferase
VVALNPALALYAGEAVIDSGDFVNTFSQAVVLAQDVIQSGEAWKKLEQLAQFLL